MSVPSYSILGNCNSANYGSIANWNGTVNGNVTNVGSNGISSYYGTFDQNGNVWEIVQDSNNLFRYGGSFSSTSGLLKDFFQINSPSSFNGSAEFGFRVCSNSGINDPSGISMVSVDDPGNTADSNNKGAVAYSFKISEFSITNFQYVDFLNSVARNNSGTPSNIWPYVSDMTTSIRGGINASGSSPNISYSAKNNMGNKPVNFIDWHDMARYVNWLYNNQPSIGILDSQSTENGIYNLNFTRPASILSPNNKDTFWIPNSNEWYKAAYYKGGGTDAGYWIYATQSDVLPLKVSSDNTGNANNTPDDINICISPTPTPSMTPSNTVTPTVTPTLTSTPTNTPSLTSSITPTNTVTSSLTPSSTPTITPSLTSSITPTRTQTKTPTRTPTQTPTNTPTPSVTPTITPSVTVTKTSTPTPSKSFCGDSIYLGQLIYNNSLYQNQDCQVVYKGFNLIGKLNSKIVNFTENLNSIISNMIVSPTPTPSSTNSIFIGSNSANYNGVANWNGTTTGNITSVGSNGGSSAYGTYDQSGNVDEWHDFDGISNAIRGIRGGNWLTFALYLSSAGFGTSLPSDHYSFVGFRIASRFTTLNPLNLSYFVNIQDINNNSDVTGYGGVDYIYSISQYLVTNCEYVEFLNCIAATDLYNLYNNSMNNSVYGGIIRNGSSGSFSYSVKNNMDNKPVVFVNWFCAARYCNWLHNGKLSGSQDINTTEDGAYTLNGAISGNAVSINSGAKYHIPIEDEWYKAAYYKAGSTNAGYWAYATQNDTNPISVNALNNGDGTLNNMNSVNNPPILNNICPFQS
jgi:formylglycine-generating enzyme required for sulfatase activity